MKVIAIDRFEYANVLRMPGDEFDTDNDEHARVLELAQRVKIMPAVDTRAMKASQRYRHRAMKADE